MVQNHPPGQHAIRRRQKVLQQRILLVRQLDALASAMHLVRQPVHLQIGEQNHVGMLDGGAPQQRLDADQQLGEIERLGQIVIGASLEMYDLVLGCISRGDHQYRQ